MNDGQRGDEKVSTRHPPLSCPYDGDDFALFLVVVLVMFLLSQIVVDVDDVMVTMKTLMVEQAVVPTLTPMISTSLG